MFAAGIPPADELGIDAVIDLGTKLSASKDALSGDGKEKQTLESLEASRQRVLATAGYLKTVQGQGKRTTIITWADTTYMLDNAGRPIGTYKSASVAVESDFFLLL